MRKQIIQNCPACGAHMYASKLTCPDCGIEICGEFEVAHNNSLNLTNDEIEFVKLFFKEEGNMSKIQQKLGIGYPAVKGLIKNINIKFGNEMGDMCKNKLEKIETTLDNRPSSIIKEKLNKENGISHCDMLRGEPLKIWLVEDGVVTSGFPDLVCEWHIFDAIVNKAKELGGKMYRGDGAAQAGAKIGSDDLPLDTIDGFISVNFYGNHEGNSTTRRSTYYAAVLAWAGICSNHRSDGIGGYILLK